MNTGASSVTSKLYSILRKKCKCERDRTSQQPGVKICRAPHNYVKEGSNRFIIIIIVIIIIIIIIIIITTTIIITII
jgi:hypothetical protein